MKGRHVDMNGRAMDRQVLSLVLKSQQRSAARRRHEAALQAEVRRLALSARRKTSPPDAAAPDGDEDPSVHPAA
jgi:hypothetical protein